MDGIDAQLVADGNNFIAPQVAVLRGRGPHAHCLVGVAHVRGQAVGLGVDGDRGQAHFAGRAQHAQGDFAAVGDQELGNLLHGKSKTEYPDVLRRRKGSVKP